MRQLEKCPDCGVRLIPRPKEIRDLRLFARLTQREMANFLGVKSSHVAYLEKASFRQPVYPYWHQTGFEERNPKPTSWTAV